METKMTIDELTPQNGPKTIEELEWRILYALKSFQIIELLLKTAICDERYCRDCAPRDMEEMAPKPLGKLIIAFSKVCKNNALLESLKEINDDRNTIAHQALINTNEAIAKRLGGTHMTIDSARDIERRASNMMSDLVLEYLKPSVN
jgi:hypothetical protein